MSSRRLAILGCKRTQIDPEDDDDLCFIVCFVEERWLHVRPEEWTVRGAGYSIRIRPYSTTLQYLSSSSFRLAPTDSRRVVVDRLLAAAVQKKYGENKSAHSLTSSAYTAVVREKEERERKGENPLNSVDCES
ncbi:hypothetical protein PFISCL1PPCAC_4690, partial [Pristionchus fissidentatus]